MSVIVFPGQGAQHKGMGAEFFDQYEALCQIADDVLGYSIKQLCLDNPDNRLQLTQYTQPALYVVNALSFYHYLKSNQMPDIVAGHSLGEYNALLAAGVFDFSTGLKLVKRRGELMSQARNGSMLAVLNTTENHVSKILEKYQLNNIDIANYNSPSQVVLSGAINDIGIARSSFDAEGVFVVPLKVSGAFHSRYMRSIAEEYSVFVNDFNFNAPKIPVVANITGLPYKNDQIKSMLVKQLYSSVQWTRTIRYLMSVKRTDIIQLGPGNVLTKLNEEVMNNASPSSLNNSDLQRASLYRSTSHFMSSSEAYSKEGGKKAKKVIKPLKKRILKKIRNTDIAIVGMACQFPGASDYRQFWNNLIAKKNSIQEISSDRWDISQYYSSNSADKNKSISKWCGLLDDIKGFDNVFFNLSPMEAENMDPQQRLLLQQSWCCIEDSAISLQELQTLKTSVFVGAMSSDYLQELHKNNKVNNRYSILGNDHCILANRISHQFNLSGESISINAASASSLVAIHKAASALISGECDYAMAAGVNLNIDPMKYVVFSQAGMLSPDGQCHSFSDNANGYVPGDGVAVVLLQPLSKAIQQKNHIHAVIKGSAVNHIGSTTKAITAPSSKAQVQVLEEALAKAQKKVDDIGYIESHGSGTVLGDPIEIDAINKVYSSSSGLIVGTVKPNIGHLEAAAGIAGVIKSVLVLKHQYAPANLNMRAVNPVIQQGPQLKFATGQQIKTDCAGVSAFGFGGISCHLLIENYSLSDLKSQVEKTRQLPNHFLLSANSKTSLNEMLEQWKTFLTPGGDELPSFRSICSSVVVGRRAFQYRWGVVAKDNKHLYEQLKQSKPIDFNTEPQKYSWVFSNVSACQLHKQEVLIKHTYEGLIKQVRNNRYYHSDKEDKLNQADVKNTLLLMSIFNVLRQLKIFPDQIELTGDGLWSALLCSEVLKLDDYIEFVFDAKSLSELTFYYPKYPIKFVDGTAIFPQYIDPYIVQQLYEEVNLEFHLYQPIVERARVLFRTQPIFKKFLLQWSHFDQSSRQWLMTLDELENSKTNDIKKKSYVIVSIVFSINCFYKKWMLENEFSQEPKYLSFIIKLLNEKILKPSDISTLIDNGFDENDMSQLNINHWQAINQLIDNNAKSFYRLAIPKQEKILSVIKGKQDYLPKINEEIQRVVLGNIEDNSYRKIDDIESWNKALLGFWLDGVNIDWRHIYRIGSFNRAPLPGYAFDKKDFWAIDNVCQKTKLKGMSITKDISKNNQNKYEIDNQSVALTVKAVLSEIISLDVIDIDMSKSFSHYGFDSMAYTELSEKINKHYRTSLTPACFYGFKSIDGLINTITKTQKEDEAPLQKQPDIILPIMDDVKIKNDIAIIGYAGVMPNAANMEEFWQNLINGVDAISEIPSSRWHWQDYYATDIKEKNKTPSKWGGFIKHMEYFDAAFFGVSPQEAKLMDPQQRILLQTVWHALEHSGYNPSSLAGTHTSVFIGASTSDYEELIRANDLAAHASTGMNRSIIANRISFLLDLHGPSEVIDTACSSSMVAIHKAVKSIQDGESTAAIVGGVNALITPTHYISYGKAGMLSPDGHCKTFDKNANGYVRSEGSGAVILKPLSQALQDCDTVHAVIKASGVNHGGRADALTAPNPNAQAQLIFDTYKKAGINSHSVDYIETHGTGTPLGDPIEINGLKKAFNLLSDDEENANAKNIDQQKCYLASVKSHIGHLEAAAGIAGLLKVILCLKNNVLPASLNIEQINPYINLKNSWFEILNENRNWPSRPEIKHRRAGISSFGFGGVNAHVVLEEFIQPNKANNVKTGEQQLVLISAKSKETLYQYSKKYINFLNNNQNLDIANIAYTSQVGRKAEMFRLAIIVKNISQLKKCLHNFVGHINSSNWVFNQAGKPNLVLTTGQLLKLVDNRNLDKLASLWSLGENRINWERLHSNKPNRQRIVLPTYPFALKKYWLDHSSHKDEFQKQLENSEIENNFIYEIPYDHVLTTEHVINEVAVSPGSFILELILKYLAQTDGQHTNWVFSDVFWKKPVLFNGNSNSVFWRVCEKQHEGLRHLEIFVSETGKQTDKVIAQAVASLSHQHFTRIKVDGAAQYQPIDILDIYAELKVMGFHYGNGFQVIKNIARYKNNYLSRLYLDEKQYHSNDYILDPRLIDGALQTCLVYLLSHGINTPYVPMMAQEIQVGKCFKNDIYAVINPCDDFESEQEFYTFNIQLMDAQQQKYVDIKNVTFKRLEQGNIKSSDNSQVKGISTKINQTTPALKKLSTNYTNLETTKVSSTDLLQKTIEYFIDLIASTASIEEKDIDRKQPFKEYGIDSFLTLTIIRNLESDFGELRKTLMFEASNINELAEIFVQEHESTLVKLFNLKTESNEPQKSHDLTSIFSENTMIRGSEENEKRHLSPASYQILSELELEKQSVLQNTVGQLIKEFGGESVALSRKSIAPNLFIPSKMHGFFYFNTYKNVLLAFRYVGPDVFFEEALMELESYCQVNSLQINVLSETSFEYMKNNHFSANPFAVVQRVLSINDFTIQGGKMRRLRYHINKFQNLGDTKTFEYILNSDTGIDQDIRYIIDKWASQKTGVNPYIWRIKDEIEQNNLGESYRLFVTYLDTQLQNVIIISRIESDNSYLLDTEFYSTEMSAGAMDFAIYEIIKILRQEGCSSFSLGLTFGGDYYQSPNSDGDVVEQLSKLAQDGVFSEKGNYQFKNKFRSDNSPLYLYRPIGQPASNVLDVIMMIGNPQGNTLVSEIETVEKNHRNSQTIKLFENKNKENTRYKLLKENGYNPFNIHPENIEYDLATDSWSELEYPFIHHRTQELQAIDVYQQPLEKLLTDIFVLPYIIPFSAGRVAESFLCSALDKNKKYVIQNVLFPTCIYHQVDNDFIPLEIASEEFHNIDSDQIFKGNIDCKILQEKLKEYENNIAFIWIELANNATGGCAVSIANLREVKSCIGDIPLILDATRIVENAYHISQYEKEFINVDIWEIIREICTYADSINASLTKDFGTHTGGFIATRDKDLYLKIQDAVATNGNGVSRNNRYLIANALLDKKYIENLIEKRMNMVLSLAQQLLDNKLSIVQPIGGHCVLIDPMSITALTKTTMPLPSFVTWVYKYTGIRLGIHSVGRQRNTPMNNLIRIAIPAGINETQLQDIADRLIKLFHCDSEIDILSLKHQSSGLFASLKANYTVSEIIHISLPNLSQETSQNTVSEFISDEKESNVTFEKTDNLDIAIIGIGGRYPDACNPSQFWENLCEGKDSIRLGPDWEQRFSNPLNEKHMGGFIDDVDKFDSLFFSISPREAKNMDPQERLMMEVSWEAMEDAGYYPESLCYSLGSNHVGVFVGAVWSYYEMLGAENRQFGGESVANSQHWGLSNRISSFMNFSGPSITIDSACSSSLAAMHLACESLRSGECKTAIVGGVNLDLHPSKYHITSAAKFLSEDGLCRAFGRDGTGYVAGEGVGAMILKPLHIALENGDHIYAIIKGSAMNHGGKTAGYTVPSPNAQADLISTALHKSNISADSISYVEAHGTGTELGDPIEIQGATEAYRKDTQNRQYCAIGSVKTNIGHLEAAAGIAGATKLALQMHHQFLVPSLHSSELNEHIDFESSPFYVQQKAEKWPDNIIDGKKCPRRAGLSSFGAGGTNVHVVFEEFVDAGVSPVEKREELIILSARKSHQLIKQASNLLEFLNHRPANSLNLHDLSYTLKVGRLPMPKRIAIIASSVSELIVKLKKVIDDEPDKNIYLHQNHAGEKINQLKVEEYSEENIQSLIHDKNYNSLASLWVQGLDIDWLDIEADTRALRISLPSYPFAKESHWMDRVVSQNNRVTQNNHHIHALIDKNISTFNQVEFSKNFDLEDFVFSDHIVDGQPTLPGVAYMEMARAAVEKATGKKDISILKNLIWSSPINQSGSGDIRIKLNQKNDVIDYEICTFDFKGNKTIHSQGKAVYVEQNISIPGRKDINSIKEKCYGYMSKSDCYDLLETRKLTYGHKLRTINGFHYGDKEGLTVLDLPSELQESFFDYQLHPSILDGAVQSIISLLESARTITEPGVPYVPFVLGELNIFRPLSKKTYAHLILDNSGKTRDDIKKIHIDILDELGNVLIQMKDFSFKAITEQRMPEKPPQNTHKTSDIPESEVIYYKPYWQSAKKPFVESNHYLETLTDAIVLFDHDQTHQNELQKCIDSTQASVILVQPSNTFCRVNEVHYQIDISDSGDYQKLIDSIILDGFVPDRFIHNLSANPYVPEQFMIEADINNSLISVFVLSQALLKKKKSIDSQSIDLTYLYHTVGTDKQPSYGAVSAFARSIKHEGANINFKTIDLNDTQAQPVKRINWSWILAEQSNLSDIEVCFKNNQRFIRSLIEFKPYEVASENKMNLYAENGVYLITGGTGGLGMLFAKELNHFTKVNLILSGRTPKNQLIQDKLEKLKPLSKSVDYISCDLTSYPQVEKMVGNIIEKYGCINGIIHSAGIIKDGFLWNKDKTQFTQVLSPKILGTHNLDKATQNIALDYFLLCSSIASIHGNMGQSDYAAGNRFMDDFAAVREQWRKAGNRQGKTVSINWPLWRDGGMHVNEGAEKWLFDQWGMAPLDTALGLQALNYSINNPEYSFGLLQGNIQKICQVIGIKGGRGTQVKDTPESVIKHPQEIDEGESSSALSMRLSQSNVNTLLNAKSLSSLVEKIQKDLKHMVVDLLNVNNSDIDFEQNMSGYGFDSVTFTEFTNLINTRLDLEITPLIFFEQETLQELTDYLLEEFSEPLIQHYESELMESIDVSPDNTESYSSQAITSMDDMLEKHPTSSTSEPFHKPIERHQIDQHQTDEAEPIAIIGMSGIMPQSPDLEVFWDNLINERNLVTEIPKDRWGWEKYYGESDLGNSKTKIKWGGFIPEIDKFDADFFNISPLEAELTDPQQRLFLETVWHTIEDSGYRAAELSGTNTGVFVGIGTSDYHELLREQNSDFEAYSVMGWMHAVLANRISYFFNWNGPSEPIGTACSSSLVAIDRAVQAIRTKRCDMCVAGGISLIINPGLHIGLGKAAMLSEDGRCKTFDHKADGYVRSEGVGAILLKPLQKAVDDGDNIYAVIKGSAVNHGGHVNTFTTPNPKAQTSVMSMAFDDAAIDPASLTYIEAHGTGTALGDPIEIQGLLKAFKNKAHSEKQLHDETEYCTLGSVKTNVGHLELAAGMAGIFKLIFALKYKKIPANINFEKINPYIALEGTPFKLANKTTNWHQLEDLNGKPIPRRAGISSFGFGGVNSHIILEEYHHKKKQDAFSESLSSGQAAQIIPISTKYKKGLEKYCFAIQRYINKNEKNNCLPSLEIFASGFQHGRDSMPYRLAFVVNNYHELKEQILAFLNNSEEFSNTNINEPRKAQKESQDIIKKWEQNADYDSIAYYWVCGGDIDWSTINPRKNKISIPTYPFQKDRYWLLNADRRGAVENNEKLQTSSLSDVSINVVAMTDENSTIGSHKFQIHVDEKSVYLNHHEIIGLHLLPAATYLEVVIYCARKIKSFEHITFSDVVWLHPITLDDIDNDIYLTIEQSHHSSFEFIVHSFNEDETVKYFCQGTFVTGFADHSSHNVLNVELFKNESMINQQSCYQQFHEKGFNYGKCLQVIEKIYIRADEVLSYLTLPACLEADIPAHTFHTAIIDGALQTILGLMIRESDSQQLQILSAVSKIEWYQPLTASSYAHVREIKNVESAVDNYHSDLLRVFDVNLYNSSGVLAVSILRMEIRPLKKEREKILGDDSQINYQSKGQIEKNTVEYLCQLVADETRRDISTIEPDASFESYGIDSFLALRMTKKLEKAVGSVNKTAFFEHTNIDSLSQYLIGEYQQQLMRLFDLNPNDTDQKESNNIESADSSSTDKINSKTIEYLRQLIADETRRDINTIEPDANFESYGIDSFLALRMSKKLEKVIGPIDKTAFFEYRTIESFAGFLHKECADQVSYLYTDHDSEPNITTAKKIINAGYKVLLESDLDTHPKVAFIIESLCQHHGKESKALARSVIAPMIFLASNEKAYFNFNQLNDVALAFTYVGPSDCLENTVAEFCQYCQLNNLQANILTEKALKEVNGEYFSSNGFAVMQRLTDIDSLSLQGSKMRRLRYQVSKFKQSGVCHFQEYTNGSDPLVDSEIGKIIDLWASNKKMVNPYIWQVKTAILAKKLPEEHRIFVTKLDKKLQNVIILTPLASEKGYLMDLEFYGNDMPLGGLEYSIWNILQQLKAEGCEVFSLGATFGVSDNHDAAHPTVKSILNSLQQNDVFNGRGNLQFKNKFRPKNTTLYLSRPYNDDPQKVVDVIMMIANPILDDHAPQEQQKIK